MEWSKGNMNIKDVARALREVPDEHVVDIIDLVINSSDSNAKELEEELIKLFMEGKE